MAEEKKMRPASLSFMGRRDPATCGIWRNTTICPVTKNLPTRMLETAFRQMCARLRLPDRPICIKCKGKIVPVGLEFIDLENELKKENDMGTVKSWFDICYLCGEKKTVRKVKDHPCCPTCEHIFRSAHSAPDRLVDALRAAHCDEYAQKFAPVVGDDGPLSLATMVGQIRERHNLAGDADVLPFVDNLVAEVAARREDLINALRRLHAAEEVIENVRIVLRAEDGNESVLESAQRVMTQRIDSMFVLHKIEELLDRSEGVSVVDAVEAALAGKSFAVYIISEISSLLGVAEGEDIIGKVKTLIDEDKDSERFAMRISEILQLDIDDDLEEVAAERMRELTSLRGMKDDVLNGELEKPWTGRESALLDLALDALAGNISGLDAGRIAALR